ncbi:MAG: protein-glutamate O-methyltransferase CheR, partial [Cytophagales bacterium]|nr:protein-glutamate O-methyltransferase CheR [Cytophagales bacterium]
MIIGNEMLSDSCFDGYSKLIHKIMGITIEKSRKTMLVGRIRKRIMLLELDNYEEYLKYIKRNRQEEEYFINAITTNQTCFYRTPMVWDFITNDFFENWCNNRKLNIWSAASSTGEEAHTVGVVCQDFRSNNLGFQYKVCGTDISSAVVAKATKGN